MNKALQVFLIIAFVVTTMVRSYACSCLSKNEDNWLPVSKSQLGHYPVIILGEVLSVDMDKDSYSVFVLDAFKGNIKVYDSLIIQVENSCWIRFDLGIGIFYADLDKNGTLNVSECSISRNLDFLSTEKPLVLKNAMGKPAKEEEELKRRTLLLKNWMNEYALLNAYRNSHQKVEEPQTSKSDYLSYLAVALSVVAVLVAFFRKLG